MNRNRCRLSILPILAAALVDLMLACKDANTITGVRVEPTPTPTAVNIAGAWTGTFNSFDFVDCESNVPAQATFTQQDSTVDGTLDALQNGCGTQNVVIHATFDGPSLHGTIDSSSGRYAFRSGSTVTGTLSGSTLEIALHDQRGGYIPGGTMQLHR